MVMNNMEKAGVLIEALPYIQKYYDKIVVIKYGGNAMKNEGLKSAVMSDLVLLSLVGIKVVLVHGGGPEITRMLDMVGIQSRFVGGLRYTDEATAQIVQMVLCGKVNKDLVAHIGRAGGRAIGVCGMDGGTLKVKKHQGDQDLGFVGDITDVDTGAILHALAGGYIPVVSTVGADGEGNVYNINADTAAARVAAALKAKNLILMTDTRGLLREKDDESTLIDQVCVSQAPDLKRQGIIQGGMIPKVDCCVEAVRQGVERAFIIDGRIPHSILIEMLSDEGIGTMFY